MPKPLASTKIWRNPPTDLWGRLRFIGPSLVLTASLVGSGELIVTTTWGAQIGFTALWIILASCLVKVAMQESLGRYVISSGVTTLRALNQLPGPRAKMGWAVWFWIMVIFVTAVQLGAIAGLVGAAISLVTPGLTAQQWAPVVCAIALAILYRGSYRVLERFSAFLVAAFSILTIVSALLVQWTPYAISISQLMEGFRFRLPEAGWGMALAVVGAVGLSSTELIVYPYWCLEKGYARFTGPPENNSAWERRARGWIKVMQLDCYFSLIVYTTTTLAFYFLGAAVLHARSEIPQGVDILHTLSAVYTETLGPEAFYIFFGAAFFVLFSTLFASIASYSWLMADCTSLWGKFPAEDHASRRKWVRIYLIFFTLLFALSSQLPGNPVFLVVLGLGAVALLLPVVCFAVLYLRYRRLAPQLNPSLLLDVWLWASALLTVVLTIFTLFHL